MAQLVKNPPAMQDLVRSLGWGDPLEKGKATHSIILAWRIPWTLHTPWDHKESDTTERLSLSFTLCDLTRNHLLIFANRCQWLTILVKWLQMHLFYAAVQRLDFKGMYHSVNGSFYYFTLRSNIYLWCDRVDNRKC